MPKQHLAFDEEKERKKKKREWWGTARPSCPAQRNFNAAALLNGLPSSLSQPTSEKTSRHDPLQRHGKQREDLEKSRQYHTHKLRNTVAVARHTCGSKSICSRCCSCPLVRLLKYNFNTRSTSGLRKKQHLVFALYFAAFPLQTLTRQLQSTPMRSIHPSTRNSAVVQGQHTISSGRPAPRRNTPQRIKNKVPIYSSIHTQKHTAKTYMHE